MAALSIELMANVENLTYTGVDADPFVGTGNSLNNVITGGDLNDTLSGLAGNDTLKAASATTRSLAVPAPTTSEGDEGADNMAGGADNDVYFVDDVGDVVNENAADSTGVDRVDIDHLLYAGDRGRKSRPQRRRPNQRHRQRAGQRHQRQ